MLFLLQIKTYIDDECKFGHLCTDCWTDNVVRLPYITFTLRFNKKQFEMKEILLAIKLFPHPHTAERIRSEIENVMTDFGLNSNKIEIVSDGDAATVKGITDAGFNHIP